MRARSPLWAGAFWLALTAAAHADEPEAFEIAAVEHVLVDDVHAAPGGESVVDVYFRALTRYRLPVEHLRPVDVAIRQDGAELPRNAVVSVQRVDEGALGVAAVIALDNSRTMLGSPFERARAQALAFLAKLAPPDQAALVAFSATAQVLVPFGQPLEEVRARVEALEPDRTAMATAVFDGIHQAAELLRSAPARPRRGFAVVFSDGRDGGSRHSLEEVIAGVQGGVAESRLPIFTIGYEGRGADGLDVLRRIAAASGADAAREVDSAEFYDDVLRQMRGSYVVRFAADLDGAPHQVGVEVEGHSETRSVAYPGVQRAPRAVLQTPWQIWALAAAAVLLLLALWLSRRSRGGAQTESAKLRFLDGPLARREVELRPGRTRIGALPDNDIAVPAPSVSRNHAEIRTEGGRWVISDLGSTNGTRVNGAAVSSVPLRPGDRIRLGEVEVLFES